MEIDPIRSILDDIRHIVRALRVNSSASERRFGLSAAQLFVLRQLEVERAVSINELAERTMTHQSSVSVVVKKLVERKLVDRKASTQDSRRAEVSLTAQGQKVLKTAPRAVQEELVEALRRMRKSDSMALADLLARLVREAGYAEGRAPLLFEDEEIEKE